jgi:hypothetical protein
MALSCEVSSAYRGQSDMNRAQHRLVIAAIAVAILMLVFPPWKGQIDSRWLGYAPITDPPVYEVPWWEIPGHPQATREDYMNPHPPMDAMQGEIWWGRMELQFFCLGVVTIVAVLFLKDQP